MWKMLYRCYVPPTLGSSIYFELYFYLSQIIFYTMAAPKMELYIDFSVRLKLLSNYRAGKW